jgi:hypothetical protein
MIQIELNPDYINHTWDICVTKDSVTTMYVWHSEVKPNLSELFHFLLTMGVK